MPYLVSSPPIDSVSDEPMPLGRVLKSGATSIQLQRSLVNEDRLQSMQRAFGPSGGLITGDALTVVLRQRSDQPLSLLARWIVNRQVVCFEAQGQTWLPMFQFEPGGLAVKAAVNRVISELRDVFDEGELAEWFAKPNSWLGERSPADALPIDPDGVLQVARADRFVAAG